MSKIKEKILVFRFSAMGDVAMTVPVIREFIEQNKDVELLIVTRHFFAPFFQSIPNITFIGVDIENYNGILGLKKLADELKVYEPTMVADLHNVLRTKILKLFLSKHVKKIATLDKNRKEKKLLTRRKNKKLYPLRPVSEYYADVFRRLGFDLKLSHKLSSNPIKKKNSIGVAPFANYKEKMLPLDKMKDICIHLAKDDFQIYLFGGGKEETEILDSWQKMHPNIHSLSGQITLKEQMNLISQLPLMITMDSANMHISSLVGTKVISIWGATHPFAGFLGYGQQLNDVIQINDLSCRPCSIFGNKPCYRNDWACTRNLECSYILNKIKSQTIL
ncbi:glycosyltransferase family 9 protein [Apibacter sp. B2966]|uniref:glycosyltransferase family 9 protein n=1 Tax=Apibacter sp. B2966 TaxID=2656761 RepID=UPI00293C10F0|nr:glycosyltransferase family 9 protein [Apibacter sp. B2966]